ncbi:MAG TPA: hypothetical protein PLX59_03205 [Candidatus Cloacimonadota bacterium]|nr:hypothetical protein [Candidatus Cloacimonadota bacterium]
MQDTGIDGIGITNLNPGLSRRLVCGLIMAAEPDLGYIIIMERR